MIVVGIDPGLTGAIAFAMDGAITVCDMPKLAGAVDPHGLVDLLCGTPAELVVLEQVNAGAIKGRQAGFTFGRGYGVLEGVLAALERPVVKVTPSKWTRALGVGSDKAEHVRRAMDLWPAQADQFRPNRHNRADAALLAFWGGHTPH